jgi:hypothetical protein
MPFLLKMSGLHHMPKEQESLKFSAASLEQHLIQVGAIAANLLVVTACTHLHAS